MSGFNLDAACAAALKRLNHATATSAGRHAGILRRRFAELRVEHCARHDRLRGEMDEDLMTLAALTMPVYGYACENNVFTNCRVVQ